ncbi:glycosyltransferase [Propioniciclava sp. MC1683]|uniref:glycosyltransferase n=1 Tax=Propioniciclava sp. MC1683 TaxID=2760309 RepID=UPI0016045682|nr:glycosyltransferase [Propioniciclava sp. MC1683]MBB1501027.1 glycosyltransferase [Propioniciclava sp. MC1683]
MDDILMTLRDAVGGRDVTLSLTSAGREIFDRISYDWLAGVLRAMDVAYPEQSFDLVLRADTREPMESGSYISPGLPGDTFTKEGGLGMVTVAGNPAMARVARRVSVPSLSLWAGDTAFAFVDGRHGLRRRIGQAYGQVYDRAPLSLDRFKQYRNNRKPWLKDTASRGADLLERVGPTAPSDPTRPPTAWFALHWLEPGGAEAWAFESAELARDAGLEVVITVDRAAPQRDLARALSITPHVYLGANVFVGEDWSRFGRMVLDRHRVVAIHIHHSAMAYQALPRLRHLVPDLVAIDSTHIAEHRTGGFVRQSLEHSDLLDVHHVISPTLRDTYVLEAGIPAERVAYRPLTGLRGQADERAPRATRTDARQPLRVGFLGRLAPQKRPFLFLELVRRLSKAAPGRFTFVMQGSGPLEQFVARQLGRTGLAGVIERRPWGPPSEFFDAIDVLAITSDNEGLTLTALEADSHGVLVLSADVGSQVTVVVPDLLAPREPVAFLRRASAMLTRLAADPALAPRLLDEQREIHDRLREVEPARDYFSSLFAALREDNQ